MPNDLCRTESIFAAAVPLAPGAALFTDFRLPGAMPCADSLRVYQIDGRVALQIRGAREYADAQLDREQALLLIRELACALSLGSAVFA
jgi:hypothetical protein